MLRLYDFRCESGEVFEKLYDSSRHSCRCKCGKVAKRLISPVRSKLDSSFPGEAIRWAKKHEQGAKEKAGNGGEW